GCARWHHRRDLHPTGGATIPGGRRMEGDGAAPRPMPGPVASGRSDVVAGRTARPGPVQPGLSRGAVRPGAPPRLRAIRPDDADAPAGRKVGWTNLRSLVPGPAYRQRR